MIYMSNFGTSFPGKQTCTFGVKTGTFGEKHPVSGEICRVQKYPGSHLRFDFKTKSGGSMPGTGKGRSGCWVDVASNQRQGR